MFDIDRTILKPGSKVHHESFSYALKEIFGIINTDIDIIHPSGKTDTRIILEIGLKLGIKQKTIRKNLSKIFSKMIEFVRKEIYKEKIELVDGVKELLKILKSKNYILGLETGNLKEIAKMKLERVGVWKFFEVGGFGDFIEDRGELVHNAIVESKKKFKLNLENDQIFVIGDTPFDIQSGKENNVKTIAILSVAKFSLKELKNSKPDYIFADYSNIKEILNVIEK